MFGDRVHEHDSSAHVGGDDRIANALERRLEPFPLFCDRLFGPALVGDVAKHEHDAENAAGVVENRRGAVRDRPLACRHD